MYTELMLFSFAKKHPLYSLSQSLRLDILGATKAAGAGHIGGALSALDVIISLYHSSALNFKHDHFVLSPGHLCLAHYTVLCHLNPKLKPKLSTFSQFGSIFQAHESIEVPGVEYSSGSLGQGLSFACGLALGDKTHHTVCITSDGEHNEGQIWEAAMFAPKYGLGNLINIVISDGIQIDGSTSQILPQGDLAAKYLRFGWSVITVDGHNFFELDNIIRKSVSTTNYPVCIIAKTTFGKGVSYMENNSDYHHVKNLPPELYREAVEELTSSP